MSDALSQQEIDQLLTGINSGEIKEEDLDGALAKKQVYEYDFRRPARVSKDQQKIFRTLHETFADLLGGYLGSHLQSRLTIDLLAIDQLSYSEYALSIANPCVVYIFDIKETAGRALMEISPEMVFMIVERLLGGMGHKTGDPRSITAIEQRIMEQIVRQALKKLTTAWESVHALNFELLGFESNADFIQISPPSEVVIVITFELKLGDNAFLMNLCYPSFALEDVLTLLNVQLTPPQRPRKNEASGIQNITRQLQSTPMMVKAVLGNTEVTIKELMELEVGDILFLENRADQDISVYVQDQVKYRGRPGTIDKRLAIKITEDVTDDTKR